MTTLYLVRHGTTTANLDHLMQGSSNGPLCDFGLRQLPYLRDHFADIPLDALYSSPYQRAVQTAEAISQASGQFIRLREDLRERDGGEHEGVAVSWLLDHYGVERNSGGPRYPGKFDLPTAEPIRSVYSRMSRELQIILEAHRRQNVAIVSHGMALQMAFAYLKKESLDTYRGLPIRNCSVTKVHIDDDGNAQFAYVGDISFFPEEIREHNESIGRK